MGWLWVCLGGAAVPLRTSQPCTCVPGKHVRCLLRLLANRCGTPAVCWLGLWGCRGDSALPSWQPHPREELCEEPGPSSKCRVTGCVLWELRPS